ncbi:MAG: SPFH domain-containing protein [Planctomycetota bacterium]
MTREKKPHAHSPVPPAETPTGFPETSAQAPDAPAPEEMDTASQSLSEALHTAFFLLKIAMIVAIGAFFFLGFFQVPPGSTALVRRFGAYRMDGPYKVRIYQPGGIYYAVPMIDQADFVNMSLISFEMNSEFAAAPVLEGVTQKTVGLVPGFDNYTITGDANILHTQWQVTYRVKDVSDQGPYRFLTSFASRRTGEVNKQTGEPIERSGPEQLLREIFQNVVLSISGSLPIDAALAADNRFVDAVTRTVGAELDRYEAGITLETVNLRVKSPPAAAKAAFNEVTQARSERGEKISSAQGQAEILINNAYAAARETEDAAEIYKNDIVASARADAENIRELLRRFPNDPEGLNVYLQQYHQEVVADLLSRTHQYIVRPGQTWFLTGATLEEAIGPTR